MPDYEPTVKQVQLIARAGDRVVLDIDRSFSVTGRRTPAGIDRLDTAAAFDLFPACEKLERMLNPQRFPFGSRERRFFPPKKYGYAEVLDGFEWLKASFDLVLRALKLEPIAQDDCCMVASAKSVLARKWINGKLYFAPISEPGKPPIPPQRVIVAGKNWPPRIKKAHFESFAGAVQRVRSAVAVIHVDNLKTEAPKDLITMTVALDRYMTSRATLTRSVQQGRLKSYRPPKSPKNTEHVFSIAELDARFKRRR